MQTPGDVGACAKMFQALDQAVWTAGVWDAEDHRVTGFPYLRVDRALAAVDPAAVGVFDAWVDRMQALDRRGREVELANLAAVWTAGEADTVPSLAQVDECRQVLRAVDLRDPGRHWQLLQAAKVPDDYSLGKRIAGLYPLSSLFFKAGVARLHERIRAEFSRPLDELPVRGELLRFGPPITSPESIRVAAVLEATSRNPLRRPEPGPAQRRALFDAFAPAFEVDVAETDERLGAPYWKDDARAAVDIGRPTVYRRLSYMRFGAQTLLQLNYVIWFPSRPRTGVFDLLGGHMDGITWRVTLGTDGRPLAYDAMHNCGCYHMFFPASGLIPRPPSLERHEEPVLVAQTAPVGPGRLVIRLAHRTHYIQRIYREVSVAADVPYVLDDYHRLRSLTLPAGGHRSLFGPTGIVAGTSRGERFFFWPMGIADPGAMRQWGRHAVSFVGRRHFDDADLLARYFYTARTKADDARTTR
ncbi:MAG: hypothetical protein DRQ37_08370 [Gammaproteobacteria bacterium]|nr:MAG: hypothetical protein DRQ37_08370 [Gammaproteobacteria bacterium]